MTIWLAMIMFEKFGQHQPMPLFERLRAHVMAADRLFGGPAPPAAVFYYSRGRRGEHIQGRQPAVISPLCLEAVQRIDALFAIERDIHGCPACQRHDMRQKFSAPLVGDRHAWLRAQRGRLSRTNDVARAMNCLLKRWPAFTRFLDDGRICLTSNAAERAAVMYSLIVSAKMNDVDPQAWLAHVLANIALHPASRLDESRPWNRRPHQVTSRLAA